MRNVLKDLVPPATARSLFYWTWTAQPEKQRPYCEHCERFEEDVNEDDCIYCGRLLQQPCRTVYAIEWNEKLGRFVA